MAKVVIDPVTSGYSLSKINANLETLAAELNNKVLYRDNPEGEPNSFSNDIDMNSNDILNASVVDAVSVQIGGVSIVPGDALSVPTAASVPNVPAGNIIAIDVQAAIDELDEQDTAHIADTTAHGTASAIVGVDDAQTLTNKTLTSPTVNGGEHTDFSSTGIDDNATSLALVIDSGERLLAASGITLGNGFVYSAANTINDYEEGTWIAGLTATTGTITLTTDVMRYTKIGRFVFAQGLFIVGGVVAPTNDLILTGLPFVVDNNTDGGLSGHAAVSLFYQNLTGAINVMVGAVTVNTTNIGLSEFDGTTLAQVANHIQAGTQIRLSAIYTV